MKSRKFGTGLPCEAHNSSSCGTQTGSFCQTQASTPGQTQTSSLSGGAVHSFGGTNSGSLFTLRAFPRFKKDRWEECEDIVTPEQPYYIVWRRSRPNNNQPLMGGLSEHLESIGHSESLSNSENLSNHGTPGYREPLQSVTSSGEATIWAYPHAIEPLVVGHVLLDLCPSGHCLARSIQLEVEEVYGAGASGAGVAEKTLEEVAGSRIVSGKTASKKTASKKIGEGETARAGMPLKRFLVSIGADIAGALPEPPSCWSSAEVLAAMDAFIAAEGLWDSTGCFHRAGVYDIARRKLITRAEDIGRHNCIDRLAGWSVLENIPLSDKVLLISARMTSSLCAKAIRAGFPVIVSRSAVTTAAIAMAQEAGVTLIGFARTQEQRFTVFNQGTCEIS